MAISRNEVVVVWSVVLMRRVVDRMQEATIRLIKHQKKNYDLNRIMLIFHPSYI